MKVEEQDAGQNVKRVTLTQYDGLSNVVKQVADLDRDGVIDDGDDQVTTYTYADDNNASLVTRVQYPDGDAVDDNVEFTYNLDGTVATRTAQKAAGDTANVIAFMYDGILGRLEKQRVTTLGTGVDGTVRSMKYTMDNLGRRQKVTSYSDDDCTTAVNEVVFDYTGLGALAAEHQEHNGVKGGNTLAVQYAYDATSGTYNGLADVLTKGLRLTDITYSNGRKSFRNYGSSGGLADKISRLAAIKDDNGSGSEGDTLGSYAYNGVGTMVVEDFEQPGVKLDYFGGTSGTYAGFDRFGRVKQQLWRDYGASADREKVAYDHDYNSNRKYRENVVAGAASKKLDELYAYDDLDRLVDFKRGKLDANKTDIPTTNSDRLRREEWTLTDVGNWSAYKVDADGDGDYTDAGDLDQSRTHNAVNELTGLSETQGQPAWADPVHDARGNMTAVPKPADMTGTYTCVYDAWNRLVKVSDGQTTVAEYRYDGLGRRIRKYVPDGGNWTVTEYYYSAGWQVLEVRRDGGIGRSGNPLAEPALATTLREQYVWSPRYIDSPILRDRDAASGGDLGKSGSGLDERLYYLTDAQMNVVSLVDTGGDAVERYTYDPYGKVTIYDGTWANTRSSSSYANEVLYCGYRLDTETGLYQVRNRVYHPLLGRWVHREVAGYVTAWTGLSLYQYVGSLPTVLTDPLGNIPLDTIWDVGCIIYDAGRAVKNVAEIAYEGARTGYNKIVGDEKAAAEAWEGLKQDAGELAESGIDLAVDAGSTLIPYVPAGATKVARAAKAVDKAADAAKAVDKAADAAKAVNKAQDAAKAAQRAEDAAKLGRTAEDASKVAKAGDEAAKVGKTGADAAKSVDKAADTAKTAKRCLRDRMGDPPSHLKKPQAHHDLPEAHRAKFEKPEVGLDIDDPQYGRWVEGGPEGNHQKWSKQFNDEWDKFFKQHENPSKQEILDKMNELRTDKRFQ